MPELCKYIAITLPVLESYVWRCLNCRIHMEQNLINDDLIRQLCAMHDHDMAREQTPTLDPGDPHTLQNGMPLETPL